MKIPSPFSRFARIISLIFALILLISTLSLLCSCDNDDPKDTDSNQLTDTQEPSQSVSESVTDEISEEPSNLERPTETPTEAPTKASTEKKEEPKEDVAVLPDKVTDYVANNPENMKALWISQFDLANIYTLDGAQRNQESFTTFIKKILSNTVANGFNTVIVQARPYADSMYPSEIYPQSRFINGKYGKYSSYDPLAIIVEEAHALGLSVQGWINPMRCMTTTEIKSVGDEYKIKQFYNDNTKKGRYIVAVNSYYYLNPAYPEVRQLIVDGAKELMEHYALDGLHMDDYFYPTTESSFDTAARKEYNTENLSVKNFRRDALNKLVSELYTAVKEVRPSALFGISPSGVMNTVYESHCADIYTWCKDEGYIDYICPQIYFGFEHATCPFDKTFEKWINIVKNPNVKLYVGISLGKAKSKEDKYAGSGKNEWVEHDDIILRELQYLSGTEKCDGVAFFCYQYFYDPKSSFPVSETKKERDNFIPYFKDMFNQK